VIALSGFLRNLELAQKDYKAQHVSAFWNIFSPDFCEMLADPDVWTVYRRNGLTFGLETGLRMDERQLASSGGTVVPEEYESAFDRDDVINRYHRLVAMAGKEFVDNAIECEAGSPRHLTYDGVRLNFDDLYQIYHAWQLSRIYQKLGGIPSTIVEIGGGYGSLCNKMRRIFPNCRYVILDLPEVLAIQYNHLRNCRGGDLIAGLGDFTGSDADEGAESQFDIALLPGWRTDLIHSLTPDLVINMRSMMEMRRPIIEGYFEYIEKYLRPGGLFYCVNRYEKMIGGESVRIKDFPFDEKWSSIVSQPTWLQTHIHELLARREAVPPSFPLSFLLESMPDASPPPAP